MSNSLAERFPLLVDEWSWKNEKSPDQVSAFSHKKVWWIGKCGHEWEMMVSDRSNGHGCPYCNDNKLLKGFNDLRTKRPDLAKEWSTKNMPLQSDRVTVAHEGAYWWRCRECGCEYKAWIQSRIGGSKCPYCTGRKIKIWVNDLTTTDPEISEEWNYEMNKTVPYLIGRNSRKEYWWECSKGHPWKAKVYDRVMGMVTCYVCTKEFLYDLPLMLMVKGLIENDIQYRLSDETITGIPIDLYIPELKVAVFLKDTWQQRNMELNVSLCKLKGIKCYRFDKDLSAEAIVKRVKEILYKNNVFVEADLIKESARLWKEWDGEKMRKHERERGPIDRLGAYLKRIFEIEKIFYQNLTYQVNL